MADGLVDDQESSFRLDVVDAVHPVAGLFQLSTASTPVVLLKLVVTR